MSLLMSLHSSCIVRIMRFKLASFTAALKESSSLFPPIAYSWIFFTEVVLVASYSFVSKTKYYYNIICLYELHFFLSFSGGTWSIGRSWLWRAQAISWCTHTVQYSNCSWISSGRFVEMWGQGHVQGSVGCVCIQFRKAAEILHCVKWSCCLGISSAAAA